jgi:hypothetical protein
MKKTICLFKKHFLDFGFWIFGFLDFIVISYQPLSLLLPPAFCTDAIYRVSTAFCLLPF